MTHDAPPPATGRGGTHRRVLVLACGDPERCDDAAALLAAEALRVKRESEPLARVPAVVPRAERDAGDRGHDPLEVEVRVVGQLEPDDLAAVPRDGAVVVVDAVRGPVPGTILVRPLRELASGGPAPRSSHVLPLRDVLGLVEMLRGSPPDGVFVGLGGSEFGLGQRMTPEVAAALPAFVAAIEREVETLLPR